MIVLLSAMVERRRGTRAQGHKGEIARLFLPQSPTSPSLVQYGCEMGVKWARDGYKVGIRWVCYGYKMVMRWAQDGYKVGMGRV